MKCFNVIIYNTVVLTIKLDLSLLASHIKQLGIHSAVQTRPHDVQWLKDRMGFFLSCKKSGIEAGVGAEIR